MTVSHQRGRSPCLAAVPETDFVHKRAVAREDGGRLP